MWFAVMAYHFAAHVAVGTESLAETVGSFLSKLQKDSSTKPFGHASLDFRARLKAAGVRGLGAEEALMDQALSTHVNSHNPRAWHFVKRYRVAVGTTSDASCHLS